MTYSTERRQLWVALSELYLDQEITEHTYRHIAHTIVATGHTFAEARAIDRQEVFPVLFQNLLTTAGVWTGWDEAWLVDAISRSLKRRNWLSRQLYNLAYRIHTRYYADVWQQLERVYAEL